MAADVGQFSIPTSASGVFDISSLPFTPTKSDLYWQGASILPGHGHQRGSDAWCFSDTTSSTVNKFIKVKNTSGTVILEGTWTSYPANKIRFNITTNTLTSSLPVLVVFEN